MSKMSLGFRYAAPYRESAENARGEERRRAAVIFGDRMKLFGIFAAMMILVVLRGYVAWRDEK